MIGIREKKKQQTRKAIVDAAVKLFAESGFEETSMEELARAAGVGKSTIYGYFAAKEEIFLAYCEAELDYAFAMLDRKIDEEAPLVDQLVAKNGFDVPVTDGEDFELESNVLPSSKLRALGWEPKVNVMDTKLR